MTSIQTAHQDKTIETWFQDESRFGQKTRLTKVWAETGSRPVVIRQDKFGSSYIFGAVNPKSGAHVGLIASHCDSDIMQLHLNEISRALAENVHAILVLDGAGWHRSYALKVPGNMSLLHLPPYSPELNPVERLWFWLKDRYLSNRVYSDLNSILDAGQQAWKKITQEVVRSVCRAD